MQIELIETTDPEIRAAIVAPLITHTLEQTGREDKGLDLAAFLRDPAGQVIGGLSGRLWMGWFKLKLAYLPQAARKSGLGRNLLAALEAECRSHGAVGSWTTSFTFQAPSFYEKQGYTRIGVLHDHPPGHATVFLAKHLTDRPAPPGIEITLDPSPEDITASSAGLQDYNVGFAGPRDGRPLVILVRHEDGGILGGLWGETARGWLFVELLGLPAELRGARLGSRLMDMAEQEARNRGCFAVHLDTFSFQARPFYEKRGFSMFAQIDGYPTGHARHFLSKRLDQA